MNSSVFQIIVLTLTSCIPLSTSLIWCYYCSDDPYDANPHRPFDPQCGEYNYQGSASDFGSFFTTCAILIRDDGYVVRGQGGGNYEDGQCGYYQDGTECYCKGDYCNTNNLCSQCWDPKTTEGTTMLSSSVSTPSTSIDTTLVTSQGNLQCYYCISCSEVDDSTSVIEDDGFQSCMTTVFLNSKEVIRGGSFDDYGFEECFLHSEVLTCVCLSDLCNEQTFG